MILIIDPTKKNSSRWLVVADGLKQRKSIGQTPGLASADSWLSAVKKFLRRQRVSLKQLSGLAVVSGQGSFTELRIAAIIANTLAYAGRLPAVGLALDEFKNDQELVVLALKKLQARPAPYRLKDNLVLPVYGREPNITFGSNKF